MNDDLTRYLDGEADGRTLGSHDRHEAELWERLTRSLRGEVPGPAPAWIESRVMADIAARRPRRSTLVAWALRPRTYRASPLALAGLAAVAVAAMLIPLSLIGPDPMSSPEPRPGVVYVQFLLEAPEAHSVAISGDFNQWNEEAVMEDADGDGIWTIRLGLEPGVHEYMFLVDGERWVTDPLAERYTDDGFGNRNAVLAVALPERSS